MKVTVLFLAGLIVAASSHATLLCSRDADITPVNPSFVEEDPCVGSVILQGISYKCGKTEEYTDRMDEFLDKIIKNGKTQCQAFCAKRAPGCIGNFIEPTKCGWSVPRNELFHVGKLAPCDDSCEGKAFIYCSIYHAAYLRVEEPTFRGFRPNCFCDRK